MDKEAGRRENKLGVPKDSKSGKAYAGPGSANWKKYCSTCHTWHHHDLAHECQ